MTQDNTLTVSIRDAEFLVPIGITDQERLLPQPLKISVTAHLPLDHQFKNAPAEDLAHSLDYAVLLNQLRASVANLGPIVLVETLGDHIIEQCLQNRRVMRVEVAIMKKDYATKQAACEVRMSRTRP